MSESNIMGQVSPETMQVLVEEQVHIEIPQEKLEADALEHAVIRPLEDSQIEGEGQWNEVCDACFADGEELSEEEALAVIILTTKGLEGFIASCSMDLKREEEEEEKETPRRKKSV